MKLTGTGVMAAAALAAVVVAGLLIWRNWPKLAASFNPASRENLAYQGTSAVISAATGREETLGGWLAELFDPVTRRVSEMLEKPAGPAKRILVPAPLSAAERAELYG